jgi:hypothetical protein
MIAPGQDNRARPDGEAERLFAEGIEELTRAALKVARALSRIRESGAHRLDNCSSAYEWAERRGCAASMARTLIDLDHALALSERLARFVEAREVTIEAGAALLPIVANPALVRDGEDWVEGARHETTRETVRKVRQRLAENRAGQPVFAWILYLTHTSLSNFGRARMLACRETGRTLGNEEAFNHVVDFYLDAKDETRVKPGKRRMPDTTGATKGRWPAQVARDILARTGGKCAVISCDNDIFIDKAHAKAIRLGGGFEKGLPLCCAHHQDYDAGRILNVGSVECPIFVNRAGVLIGGRVKAPLPPMAQA